MTLFVDTSAFFAAADEDDLRNRHAKRILASGEPLLTTDQVPVECWLLMRRRLGRPAADRLWSALRRGAASLEPVGPADIEVAWEIGRGFPDQDSSIVDRTSFAVMRRLGISRAASFDHHFAAFRFGRNRDRAFEIFR